MIESNTIRSIGCNTHLFLFISVRQFNDRGKDLRAVESLRQAFLELKGRGQMEIDEIEFRKRVSAGLKLRKKKDDDLYEPIRELSAESAEEVSVAKIDRLL